MLIQGFHDYSENKESLGKSLETVRGDREGGVTDVYSLSENLQQTPVYTRVKHVPWQNKLYIPRNLEFRRNTPSI